MPMSDPKWTPDELVELCKAVLDTYRAIEVSDHYRPVRLGGEHDGVMSLELEFGLPGRCWQYLVPIPSEVLAAINDPKLNPYHSASVGVRASRVICQANITSSPAPAPQPPPGVEP